MTIPVRWIAFAVCLATLSCFGIQTAQAKQQCHAEMPSDQHGQWWSYRLIDGRKCWYEGKPMLSKSLLEWSGNASVKGSAQPNSSKEVKVAKEKSGNPLAAQAWAPKDQDTFEARWRARIKPD